MLRFLAPYKKEFILGPLFKLAEAVLELMLPTVTAFIIDRGIVAGDRGEVLKWGAVMLVFALTGWAAAVVCQFFASRASQGLGTDLRNSLFEKIFSLSESQRQRFGNDSLTNRVIVDVNQIQTGAAMVIRLLIRAPFLCIGGIVMAAILNPPLSLLFILLTGVTAAVSAVIFFKSVPMSRKAQSLLDALTVRLRQNLSGVRVIRAFTAEEREINAFRKSTAAHEKQAAAAGILTALTEPATTLLLNFGVIGVIAFGGWRVRNGEMSRGEIVALINYFIMILNAFVVVSNLAVLFSKTAAATARVKEILNSDSGETTDGAAVLPPGQNQIPLIEFQNVTFRYAPGTEAALKNVSFRLFKGQMMGIIGGTGSGKTTLGDLIQRFHQTDEGRILVNGSDIRELSPKAVRELTAAVSQEKTLFSGTVAENLRWGNPDADDAGLEAALRAARAEDFVKSLPAGLQTPVERGGVNFSGGQRQRLCLARAFLKPAPVLLLDDAFSALDAETGAAVRAGVEGRRQSQAVIVISQRTENLRRADFILTLENGAVVGAGTHESLLKTCAVYREIAASQGEGS